MSRRLTRLESVTCPEQGSHSGVDARSIATFLQRFALVLPVKGTRDMRFILLVTRFAVFSRPALAQDKVKGVQNHPHVALPHRTTYNHEQMNPSISLAIDLTPSVRSELRWELAGVGIGFILLSIGIAGLALFLFRRQSRDLLIGPRWSISLWASTVLSSYRSPFS